jgi:transcription antitermination factor NusG
MATFLAYVSGGVCRDTHAPTRNHDGEPIRAGMTRKQLWVIEELRRLGINAWCGTRVEFKRTGKSREWARYDVPALPNYIVVDMDPQDMFTVTSVAHVSPTMTLVAGAALKGIKPCEAYPDGKVGLQQFRADVEAAFSAAERVDANSRAEVTEYKRGQSLRVVSGPFADMLVTFEKLVKAPHDKWQRIAGTTAGGMPVQFDPLDVRSA